MKLISSLSFSESISRAALSMVFSRQLRDLKANKRLLIITLHFSSSDDVEAEDDSIDEKKDEPNENVAKADLKSIRVK